MDKKNTDFDSGIYCKICSTKVYRDDINGEIKLIHTLGNSTLVNIDSYFRDYSGREIRMNCIKCNSEQEFKAFWDEDMKAKYYKRMEEEHIARKHRMLHLSPFRCSYCNNTHNGNFVWSSVKFWIDEKNSTHQAIKDRKNVVCDSYEYYLKFKMYNFRPLLTCNKCEEETPHRFSKGNLTPTELNKLYPKEYDKNGYSLKPIDDRSNPWDAFDNYNGDGSDFGEWLDSEGYDK